MRWSGARPATCPALARTDRPAARGTPARHPPGIAKGGPARRLLVGRGQVTERLLLHQVLAELGEGAGEQPGYVHLRYADLLGDLGLGHVAEEPQQQDLLLPGWQLGQQRLE